MPKGTAWYVDAQLQLAYLAQAEGNLSAASEYAAAALAARPGTTSIIDFQAMLYRERSSCRRRSRDAQQLVDVDPDNDRYHFTLGALYDEADDDTAAMDQMRRAIELNPENAAALNYLGYTYAEQGVRLDEAEALVRRALAISPHDGFYVDSLGWVYYQRGDYEQAIEQLERAVELAADDPTIAEHLGDAYIKAGRSPRHCASIATRSAARGQRAERAPRGQGPRDGAGRQVEDAAPVRVVATGAAAAGRARPPAPSRHGTAARAGAARRLQRRPSGRAGLGGGTLDEASPQLLDRAIAARAPTCAARGPASCRLARRVAQQRDRADRQRARRRS